MGDCSYNWPDHWDKLTIIGRNREKEREGRGIYEDVDVTLFPRTTHNHDFPHKNHRSLKIIFDFLIQ